MKTEKELSKAVKEEKISKPEALSDEELEQVSGGLLIPAKDKKTVEIPVVKTYEKK